MEKGQKEQTDIVVKIPKDSCMVEKNQASGARGFSAYFLCEPGETFGKVLEGGEGKREDASLLVLGWQPLWHS